MKKRIEFLTINADENIIGMVDAWANKEPNFTVESYWDEFCDIMQMLHAEMEKKRDQTLIVVCRCTPCMFIFETPIPTHITPNPFNGICCPQCGNENVNVISSQNYRAWEKEQDETTQTSI